MATRTEIAVEMMADVGEMTPAKFREITRNLCASERQAVALRSHLKKKGYVKLAMVPTPRCIGRAKLDKEALNEG